MSASESRRFRTALGQFATGVAVVTTRTPDGHDLGMTISSFTSVSLEPPLVLFCIDRGAYGLPAWLDGAAGGDARPLRAPPGPGAGASQSVPGMGGPGRRERLDSLEVVGWLDPYPALQRRP